MKSFIFYRSLASILVFGCFVGLVGLLSYARALAQTDEPCPLPPGVTPPPAPAVTAQQVEDGSATLMEFALASRGQFSPGQATSEESFYFGCLIRQEGSHWRSGSTYFVSLTPDSRVLVHAKDMALSGRLLNPLIYAEILSALGVSLTDLADLSSPDPATAAQAFAAVMNTLMQEPDAPFDATTPIPGLRPGIPGASGYAAVYLSDTFGLPLVLLAGFDLNESHLSEEDIDYGDPAITAMEVVDRETLKAFVTQAGEYVLELQKTGDVAASSKARIALRDPNGPWRHGPVYLYIIDRISNIILFHGAFPDRFELQPPGISRDAVTGELIRDQIIAAATSSSEGGFWQYHFDDPTDDTDSVDIPKEGYAREFKGESDTGGRVVQLNFIVGSGFYTGTTGDPNRAVLNTTLTQNDQPVADATVEFSRSIAGRAPEYQWQGTTDAEGSTTINIQSDSGVSGYYLARAKDADGNTLGIWSSIPINGGEATTLTLPIGDRAQMALQNLVLYPNVPNPFNPSTQIAYQIPEAGHVSLAIYNTLGQQVRVLVQDSQAPGHYQVTWDGKDMLGREVSSGVYIYRLAHSSSVVIRQLLLVK